MPRVCQVTKRRPQTGHKISHAKNKTKRRFLPNLHKRRLWLESEKQVITLNVSNKQLHNIT